MPDCSLHLLSADNTGPHGSNPAGVRIGETAAVPKTIQRIAAEVGFSETAFMIPKEGLLLDLLQYPFHDVVPQTRLMPCSDLVF
nr:PhzF family phenazine biosynthesis protein [Acaryochloris sp. IP29b_bin.137]